MDREGKLETENEGELVADTEGVLEADTEIIGRLVEKKVPNDGSLSHNVEAQHKWNRLRH